MPIVHHPSRAGSRRRATAAVEFAVLLPFLVFLFVLAVDYCRIFYYTLTVENCARNGALWAADSFAQGESPYANVTAAARADFPQDVRTALAVSDPAPVVSSNGVNYVEVTCTYQFQTITSYPGVAGPWTIRRVVRARGCTRPAAAGSQRASSAWARSGPSRSYRRSQRRRAPGGGGGGTSSSARAARR